MCYVRWSSNKAPRLGSSPVVQMLLVQFVHESRLESRCFWSPCYIFLATPFYEGFWQTLPLSLVFYKFSSEPLFHHLKREGNASAIGLKEDTKLMVNAEHLLLLPAVLICMYVLICFNPGTDLWFPKWILSRHWRIPDYVWQFNKVILKQDRDPRHLYNFKIHILWDHFWSVVSFHATTFSLLSFIA